MATAALSDSEIGELFSVPNTDLRSAIIAELQSILRIHNVPAEDLSFKWESYCLKMGSEDTHLDLKTVQDFKKDLHENLERESRSKASKAGERRTGATPRAGLGGDVFDMLVPNTPTSIATRPHVGSSLKRKSAFETPGSKASRIHPGSSPLGGITPGGKSTPATAFADRKDSGAIVESLNDQIRVPPPDDNPPSEPRIKLKSNTEMAKFAYKTMSMKLSEASELLDDRIEEFAALIQEHHKLEDGAFGNPASMSQAEIVAVGRIASDSGDGGGRLNENSLVLEPSRRMGAGVRAPLRVGALPDFQLFPGKIVALRGVNATGEFFSATGALAPPPLYPVSSDVASLDANSARVAESGSDRPLVVMVASGPYTRDDDLDFAPLHALLAAAEAQHADALLLSGPFVDAEHPLVRTGDFDLPAGYPADPDRATLTDLFRACISAPLSALAAALPGCAIALCPSPRDAVGRHVAWPQDRLAARRGELALPRTASLVPNPMLLSLNEAHVAVSTLDALQQISVTEAVSRSVRMRSNLFLERLARQLLEQRHLFPLFPPADRQQAAARAEDDGLELGPIGSCLDVAYLKLGELRVKPDVLVTTSILPPFVKVVDGTFVLNPGSVSKKQGPGTYARLIIQPLEVTDEEREKDENIGHRLYERCRADIIRI